MGPTLTPDFLDVLSVFIEDRVEFLIVGGFALARHGYLRVTGDIDLWVKCSPENAVLVVKALKRFEAPMFNLTVEDFARPGTGLHIGVPPDRIDILTNIAGVNFDDAYPRRVYQELGGLQVPVIGYEDLLANKLAAGRPKDKKDAKNLVREAEKLRKLGRE